MFETPEEMMEHYHKLVAEQEEVKKRGYATDQYCWLCKKFFKKLGYRICDNGYISYVCYPCLDKE